MNKLILPLAGALLAAATPALAQAQAQAADPAKLAEAHAIMNVAYPPATRGQMMDQILGSMQAAIRQGVPAGFVKDPGLKSLFDEMLEKMQQQQRVQAKAALPKMLDAMAIAYTHKFSLAELKDVHAFALTPSGQRYFSHAAAVMTDPAVKQVMTAMIADAQQDAKPILLEFKEKVQAYVKAHPEVAQKIAAEGQ